MENGGDVRDHVSRFFDAVDKLSEIEVEIHPDLLSIMLLYSLPSSYENFRCAIESRDALPSPETLRVKIIEESDARSNDAVRAPVQNALYADKGGRKARKPRRPTRKEDSATSGEFKFRCHRCGTVGHKAAKCTRNIKSENATREKEKDSGATSMRALVCPSEEGSALRRSHTRSDVRWCLDSGATSHLSNSTLDFDAIHDETGIELNLANGSSTSIRARGEVSLRANVLGKVKDFRLIDALHVPDLRTNLLSVGRITDKGYKVIFNRNTATVCDSQDAVILIADRMNGLYYVRDAMSRSSNEVGEAACHSSEVESLETWHRRLGHLNERYLLEAARNESMLGIKLATPEGKLTCSTCVKAKMTKTPFIRNNGRITRILEIVHSDVCGPIRIESHGRAKYFVTFIDDHSKWCEVRFLKSKSEVTDAFKEYKAQVENLKDSKIKYLQSDNGTEYRNRVFDTFLAEHGIARRLSVPHHPEQNGTAERKNRTLLDTARCLMLQSGLPGSFWAEAVSTANYVRNRTPSSSLGGKTPFEIWTGRKPDVSYFREFGSRAFYLDTEPSKGKFDSRSKPGIFLGYSELSKGYRIWSVKEKKVILSRSVNFVSTG